MEAVQATTNAPRRTVTAGLIVALVTITNTFAYASFLAGGSDVNVLPAILASALLSTALMSCLLARWHSVPSAMGGPAGNAAAVVGAALSAVLGHETNAARGPLDIVVVLALTALLPGAAMLILARLRLSRAIRFMPYPVIAGFFAGTGWLMVTGSARIAGGPAPIAAAVALALVLRLAQRRWNSPLLIPAGVLGATLLVHATLAITHTPLEAARAGHWLYAGIRAAAPVVLAPAAIAGANWPAIAGAWSAFAWVVIVVVLVSLMNGAALERESGTDSDVDRDMAAVGGANLLAGVCGGFGSQVVLPTSLIALTHARGSRIPALIVCVAALAAMIGAGGIVPWLSPPVFAAVIALFGMGLLEQYIIGGLRTMPRSESAAVIVMLVCTAAAGLQAALVVGSIVACITFTAAAGRGRIIGNRQSLRQTRSRIERTAPQRALLDACHDAVEILSLQGNLFFGSAHALFGAIAGVLDANTRVRIIVLDFAAVHALDVSAAITVEKLRRRATRRGAVITFSGLTQRLEQTLRASGAIDALQTAYARLDDAIEACEQQLLDGVPAPLPQATPDECCANRVPDMRAYAERCALGTGQTLFVAGTAADALYMLETGRLAVMRAGTHVQTLLPGSLVGEVAFFSGLPRSASVLALDAVVVARLSRTALDAMERDDPRLHAAFSRYVMRAQADRMRSANAELLALRR